MVRPLKIQWFVEGAYSIINNFDPRENRWYNDTDIDIPESSLLDFLFTYLEYAFVFIILIVIADVLCGV